MHTRADRVSDLIKLRRSLRGRLLTPDDGDWDQARLPWNRRDQRPVAIVEALDPADVVATVRHAAAREMRVSAQATGHGAGGALDDTILVRTQRWRGVTLQPERGRATVAPGTRWRDLQAAAGPAGLTGLAGSTLDLGVVGYSLLGGVGWLARRFGFASNQVLAAEVVTAGGELVRADPLSHPDLFWALRGAGGGFGVVTALEVGLQRVPELYGGQLIWDARHARTVLHAWSQWVAGLPVELTSRAAILTLPRLLAVPEEFRGRTVATVSLCFAGSAHLGEGLAAPLRGEAPILADSLRPLPAGHLGEVRFEPADPLPARIRADLLRGFPPAAVDAVLAAVGPDNGSPPGLVEISHLGGALARPDPGHGALGHVEDPFLVENLGFAITPELDAVIYHRQQDLARALESWLTDLTLPSYADPVADAARVFDPATAGRLREVKRRYDPAGTLRASFDVLEAGAA